MRPTMLIPGRKYKSSTDHGEYEYTFVKRLNNYPRPSVNIFQCDKFAGLYGPDDKGIVHVTDYRVSRNITPIPQQ